MIELWGRKNSYNVQKVLWTLAELGLDYRHRDVGSRAGDLTTDEFLAMNPRARIPVLVDADTVIWESNSIVRYLAAAHGEEVLWPIEARRRSYADRWMDWELATLQPDFIELFWGFYRKPESRRDQGLIDTAKSRCEASFRLLDDHLDGNQYLAGDDISMADIPAATALYRYFEMGVDVEQPPNVIDWYRRLCQRAAYRQTIMIDFSELKGREEF